jgi:hypothetical protein
LIGQRQYLAHAATPLPIGETVQLKVVQPGDQPILQRLGNPPQSGPAYLQVLRTALPRQGSMTPLLANLAWLAKAPPGQTASMPPALIETAKTLFSALPDSSLLPNPGTLKNAIANSGNFYEARLADTLLAGQTRLPQQDLKEALLKLAALMEQIPQADQTAQTTQNSSAPPPLAHTAPTAQPQTPATLARLDTAPNAPHELSQQVEASLARIELAQIRNLPDPTHPGLNLLVEVPLRDGDHADVFHLQIQEEEHGAAEAVTKSWAVTVAFELAELGPIHAKLWLQDDALSANLWVEKSETHQMLEENIDDLLGQFSDKGLEVANVCCFEGQPPEPLDMPWQARNLNVIDLEV